MRRRRLLTALASAMALAGLMARIKPLVLFECFYPWMCWIFG